MVVLIPSEPINIKQFAQMDEVLLACRDAINLYTANSIIKRLGKQVSAQQKNNQKTRLVEGRSAA